MYSVDDKIIRFINKYPHGKIFFADSFSKIASSEAVRKSLSRLVQSEKIVRLAHGIYWKPKTLAKEIASILGVDGLQYPTLDEVAKAIAQRNHVRIIPTGVMAENKLGLSTQIPMNCVYITDGSPRHIKIYDGKGITFKSTNDLQIFRFKHPLMQLLTLALKSIGKESITKEHLARIKNILINNLTLDEATDDFPRMPVWIRKITVNAYA